MQVLFQISTKNFSGRHPYRYHRAELPIVPTVGSEVMFPLQKGSYEPNVIVPVETVVYEMPSYDNGKLIVRVLLQGDKLSDQAFNELISQENTATPWITDYR